MGAGASAAATVDEFERNLGEGKLLSAEDRARLTSLAESPPGEFAEHLAAHAEEPYLAEFHSFCAKLASELVSSSLDAAMAQAASMGGGREAVTSLPSDPASAGGNAGSAGDG